MQKISPCLWFDSQAEEAAKFYVSIFKNSKIKRVLRVGDNVARANGNAKGSVLFVEFVLDGEKFAALNGGPQFKINQAISFMVHCESQREVDGFWKKLSAGGEKSNCGWLKDKFGVSWQITPTVLLDMHHDKNAKKSEAVMAAMMTMNKLDIKRLKKAYRSAR
jgi:predicted 3-demethylubiquinone-9 3-methyltransferase (glyoxalase superfamily)